MQRPLGLFSLLDEESTISNGTDLSFANKLKLHLNPTSCFKGERENAFTVCHNAGEGQLFQLMQRLENTTPHFIHCIKPNNFQSPGLYEQGLVLQQLRCCGVLEVVRISRSGFPTRMTHHKFAQRYGFLLLDSVASQDPLSVSVSILHQFGILDEKYQVGYTKLFI